MNQLLDLLLSNIVFVIMGMVFLYQFLKGLAEAKPFRKQRVPKELGERRENPSEQTEYSWEEASGDSPLSNDSPYLEKWDEKEDDNESDASEMWDDESDDGLFGDWESEYLPMDEFPQPGDTREEKAGDDSHQTTNHQTESRQVIQPTSVRSKAMVDPAVGMMWSEIFAPPRAKRPFRVKVYRHKKS